MAQTVADYNIPRPVNDGPVLFQPEDPWFRVARLRLRGDTSDFNKAKTHLQQAVHGLPVFVKPCCQTDGICKLLSQH